MAITADVLIVGGGLAGTTLAWRLRWAGASVVLIDRPEADSSSRVAAGLLTPITGQRLATTWRLADLWPAAVAHYARVEAVTGVRVFHPGRMLRLFAHEPERDLFAHKRATFADLVFDPDPPADADSFLAPYGGFEMAPAARLDVPDYLDASHREFADAVHQIDLDVASDIAVSPDGVRVPRLGLSARAVAFCQGHTQTPNPWFPGVQFFPRKGELLTLAIPGLTEVRIVHRGVWLMPCGPGIYRAGSTYDRAETDRKPTAAGRAEIEARLRDFLRRPFTVIDHRAGIRPVVDTSRPAVGVHPEFPHVGYLNGLGSKGALVAPYFAEQLAAKLLGRGEIDPSVGVERFRGRETTPNAN